MVKIRKVVFPVAGMGTRFLPATKAIPKEMLPLVDRPLIQYAVEEALSAGIDEFIFVTAPGKAAIQAHFDTAPALEAALQSKGETELIKAVEECCISSARMHFVNQHEALGLGHVVWCARDVVGDEPFAVILPDDVIHARRPCIAQMMDQYGRTGGHMVAAMEVRREETSRYSIIDIARDDGLVVRARGLVEKPKPEEAPSNVAVIGRYILNPIIFDQLGRTVRGAGGEIQLTDAIAAQVNEVGVHGCRFHGQRFDCGSKLGFLEATVAFGLMHVEIGPAFAQSTQRSLAALLSAA